MMYKGKEKLIQNSSPADFELDERHVIKNEEVALDRLRVRQNVFLVVLGKRCRPFLRHSRKIVG